MITKKVMQFVDLTNGIMQCQVCGHCHVAIIQSGGRIVHKAWNCENGCEIDTNKREKRE